MTLLNDGKARTALRRALLRWYDAHARDLPWRRTRDPYRIWLSEIMLQQTQVATVVGYYQRFLERFPTVHDLAAAPLDDVLKRWEGLGYYSRARNLHRAAQLVAREHDGVFPATAADLAKLPGVGRYTAAAIASIAHDEPAAVLDGNVKRVLARLLAVSDSIDERTTLDTLWQAADTLLSRRRPGDHNQALMELGARVCTPRQPQCLLCPVSRWCAARAQGIEQQLPVRAPKRAVPEINAAAGLVRDAAGRLLLIRQPERGLLGGLWALPTVEPVDPHDGHAALGEMLRTLVGPVQLGRPRGPVTHTYTHRRVHLTLYEACLQNGQPPSNRKPASAPTQRWVAPAEIDELALGQLYHKALAAAGLR
jgi:A/G-specific adenine glycosylase